MKILNLYSYVGQRIIVLYCLLALLFTICVPQKVIFRAKLNVLSRLIPDFRYLIEFNQHKEGMNRENFKDYILYFEKVIETLPNRDDASEMLGYCYYQLGEKKKAIDSLQKAFELTPAYFWFPYNLGLALYKEGRYKEAIEALNKAINANPEIVPKYIENSIVYRQIFASAGGFDSNLIKNLKTAYGHSYALLVLSYDQLHDYDNVRKLSQAALVMGYDYKDFFYFYAGLASYHLKDYKSAVYFLKESITVKADFADAYYYLGLCFKSLGAKDVAISILQKADYLKSLNKNSLSFDTEAVHPRVF